MTKVFKYHEALKKARALIDANRDKKLQFKDLYTYDKEAKGYIKTS
jgi:hypothetical protein